jgi:hypothetical protein
MNLQTPAAPSQPQLPEIHDIAHPVDVFPWPLWMIVAAALVALVMIGLLVWAIVLYLRRRPPAPPPTPRMIAMRELEQLRVQVEKLDPYAFSVKVSDVLRTFIEAHFGLRATQQTSPEFLASISGAAQFSDNDRELLAQFLERCDLIKFARIDASSTDSTILLERAIAFVQGVRT